MREPAPTRLIALFTILAASTTFAQFVDNGSDPNGDRQRARNAAMAAAQGQVTRAQQLLNVAEQRVKANWKANPQYLLAQKEQDDAKKAYGAERDRVLETLKGQPDYVEAKENEANAAQDVVDAQDKVNATQPAAPSAGKLPDPSPDQIAAAQQKLNSKARARKLVDDAVAADPAATQAKQRLDKANTDLKAMSLQLQAALLNDPDYKSSLDQLTQAKAQLAAAAGSD